MGFSLGALVHDLANTARKKWVSATTRFILPPLLSRKGFGFLDDQSFAAVRDDALDLHDANTLISRGILSGSPFMVSRFGKSELRVLLGFRRLSEWSLPRKLLWLALNLEFPRWKNDRFAFIGAESGFFPTNDFASIQKFCDVNVSAAAQVDLLGSWVAGENQFDISIPHVTKLADIEPFFALEPWTKALANKKVLVVHPFSDSILSQFKKRNLLFSDSHFLPDLELAVIPAPVTYTFDGDGGSREGSWFDVLEDLKRQVSETDFDVAIIGAGAYGMPLAAYCKALGKVAIHMGGSTQLLFGIRGRRWEEEGKPHRALMNKEWVRPLPKERPDYAANVEKEGYW
jgi:hypothetical protein